MRCGARVWMSSTCDGSGKRRKLNGSAEAEHASGADGPQRRLLGRSQPCWLWAAAHRGREAMGSTRLDRYASSWAWPRRCSERWCTSRHAVLRSGGNTMLSTRAGLPLLTGLMSLLVLAGCKDGQTYRYAVPEVTDDGWETTHVSQEHLNPD